MDITLCPFTIRDHYARMRGDYVKSVRVRGTPNEVYTIKLASGVLHTWKYIMGWKLVETK